MRDLYLSSIQRCRMIRREYLSRDERSLEHPSGSNLKFIWNIDHEYRFLTNTYVLSSFLMSENKACEISADFKWNDLIFIVLGGTSLWQLDNDFTLSLCSYSIEFTSKLLQIIHYICNNDTKRSVHSVLSDNRAFSQYYTVYVMYKAVPSKLGAMNIELYSYPL